MQLDVNRQSREAEQKALQGGASGGEARKRLAELAAQQGRLAVLLLKLLPTEDAHDQPEEPTMTVHFRFWILDFGLPLVCVWLFGLGMLSARAQAPAGAAEDENPLLRIARQMQQAESLLAKPNPGAQTKQVQEQIVADLDRLLKSCQNSSSSPGGQCTPKPGGEKKPGQAGKKPGSQGAQPNPKPQNSGTRAKDEPAGRQAAARRPPVQGVPRDAAATQAPADPGVVDREFLPKYKSLIEAYYRDLAEEQNGKPQE